MSLITAILQRDVW